MRINDDLTKPTIVLASQLAWSPSPAAGVDRKMLYRVGNEVARATSIVRYAKGSVFPPHVHGGGEEILVLDGVFQDEHGDYPAGTYFRNPPGTSHKPGSADGCTIFVRLWQFRAGDHVQIARKPGEGKVLSPRQGASGARLVFEDKAERVFIEDWRPGAMIQIENPTGLEFLVVSGTMTVNNEDLSAESWGRLPAGQALSAKVGPGGAKVWLKEAALQFPDILPMPS